MQNIQYLNSRRSVLRTIRGRVLPLLLTLSLLISLPASGFAQNTPTGATPLAWSPDGDNLAIGWADGTVRVWNKKAEIYISTLRDLDNPVTSIAWSSDGNHLSAGTEDGTVQVWDTETWDILATLTGPGRSAVSSIETQESESQEAKSEESASNETEVASSNTENASAPATATPVNTPTKAPAETPAAEPTVAPTTAPAAAVPTAAPAVNQSKIALCKLPSRPVSDSFAYQRLGIPRHPGFSPSIGTVEVAVLFAEYSDAQASNSPQEVFASLKPNETSAFFQEASYSRLEVRFNLHSTWLRLSQSANHYKELMNNKSSEEVERDFIEEVIALAGSDVNFSNADVILVVPDPQANNGIEFFYGYSSAEDTQAIQANDAAIRSGLIYGNEEFRDPQRAEDLSNNVAVRRLALTMTLMRHGFRDSDKFGELSTPQREAATGSFSIMGNATEAARAPGFFAFERWQLGWLDDGQIFCQTEGKATTELSAIGQPSGIKSVMIPLGEREALVVESRRATGIDSNLAKEGALVYTVDTSVAQNGAPIQVLPALANDPYRDQSPLAEGESVTHCNITITNVAAKASGDTVSVEVGDPINCSGGNAGSNSAGTSSASAATAQPSAGSASGVLSGRIAFPSFEDGNWFIYVMNADGSGLQKVRGSASQPALSFDGERLAFRNWESDNRSVSVMDTFGGNFRRLSDFLEDMLPAWSPDGKTIVFFSRRNGDRKSRIHQASVENGNEWNVGDVRGEYPTWLPSGRIAYRATSPQISLSVMNNDGGNPTSFVADGDATAPAISPDGKTLLYMTKRDGNWEIYSIVSDGSDPTRVTNNPANDGLPAWSPDGQTIAFASDRSGTWAIWLMNADGSGQRELVKVPGTLDGYISGEPDFSARGWVEERISWAGGGVAITSSTGSSAAAATDAPVPVAASTALNCQVSIDPAQISYYNITGSTESELRSAMDQLSPKADENKDFSYRWYYSWDWPDRGSDTCDLAAADVSLEVELTMPCWQAPADASPELMAKWEAYIQGIVSHYGPKVENKASNLSTVKSAIQGATCSTADAAAENALEALRNFDSAYNAQTDRGKNQGAVFP